MCWWCANQWQLSWDSTSYQKRNNTRSSLKNTSYYCYKAQLQFAGWLKQHVRRTGFRGQRCLPGGEGESCPGSWHLDKLLERSRCMSTGSNVMMIHHCPFCQGLKRSAEGRSPLALRISSWKITAALRGHSFLAMYWFFINCAQGRFTPPSRVSDTSVAQGSV